MYLSICLIDVLSYICLSFLIVLDHSNGRGWYLYDAQTLNKIQRLTDMPDGVGDGGPRWDATNPNVFYFTKYMVVYKYDISQPLGSRMSVVHDFIADYPLGEKIDWRDEGESSEDTNHWAIAVIWDGAEQAILTYEKSTDTVLDSLTDIPYEVDWVSMSPSGDYLVVRCSYCGGEIHAYNRNDFSNHRVIATGSGHADRAKSLNGEDLVIYFDSSDNNWITIADMAGDKTQLIKYDAQKGCAIGGHFSGDNYNKPGWALVETICSPDSSHTGWLDSALFMVELVENPRVWQVAHHRTLYDSCWSNPFANLNRSGTKIYFGSNWGAGDVTNMDVYKIDLSDGWWDDLTGELPVCYFADFDCNGDVNSADFAYLLGRWLQSSGFRNEDFNSDGKVDVKDMGILASNWGTK